MKETDKENGYARAISPEFVALKIIHEGHGDDASDEIEVFETLSKEGATGGGIIELHEVFEVNSRVCLAFELHGEPLYDVVAESGVPLAEVKSIGRQVAGALEALHGAGYAHTDLKTENILYRNGEAKLIDFSTADNALERGDDFGTREYRAPEVILGSDVDLKVDIWSLGCCLFELIGGDYLFDPHGSLWSRRKKSGKGQEKWDRLKAAVAEEEDAAEGDSFSAGEILGGKYLLEKELGEGHFSVVWKARVLREGPAGGKGVTRGDAGGSRRGEDDDEEEGEDDESPGNRANALLDEYDLVLDRELLWLIECSLGEYPRERARRGRRYERFFDSEGRARCGWEIDPLSLGEALVKFYGVDAKVAGEAEAFLTPLLDYDPAKRPTAGEIKRHPWLRE